MVAPLVTPAASPVDPMLAANTLPPSAALMESTAALEVRSLLLLFASYYSLSAIQAQKLAYRCNRAL